MFCVTVKNQLKVQDMALMVMILWGNCSELILGMVNGINANTEHLYITDGIHFRNSFLCLQ
jgi:hypothetical protein